MSSWLLLIAIGILVIIKPFFLFEFSFAGLCPSFDFDDVMILCRGCTEGIEETGESSGVKEVVSNCH